MGDENNRAETRLTAANSLLDRSPLRRGQELSSTVTVGIADPAALNAEVWKLRSERSASAQVLDLTADALDASCPGSDGLPALPAPDPRSDGEPE